MMMPARPLLAWLALGLLLAAPPGRSADTASDTVDELNFYNTDLHLVLKTLAERTGNSFVEDIPVEGKTTIHISKKTPVAEVLDQMLRGLNLSWRLERGVYHVGLKLPPKGAPVGKGLVAKEYGLENIPAVEALEAVRPLLSDYGKLTADLGLNAITVTDVSEVQETVKTLLASLDVEGRRPAQINVQIKLLQIDWSKDHTTSASFRWDKYDAFEVVGSQYNETLNNDGGGDGRGWGQNWEGGGWSDWKQKDEYYAYYPKGLTFKAGQWGIDQVVTRFFAALGTDRVNVLSEPDVTVTDGQDARIMLGERLPQKTSGGFTFESVGIELKVKPKAAGEGQIELELTPRITGRDPTAVGNGVAVARLNLREVNTKASVVSGGTVRIGGLINTQETRSVSKVPVLGDIPLLGMFFRRSVAHEERSELVILVSPRLLERIPPRCATTAGISALTASLIAGTPDALLDWSEDVPFDNVGVVRYHVYRDVRPVLSTAGLAPLSREVRGDVTSWTDYTPKRRGLTYYYAVTAVDGAGNEQAGRVRRDGLARR
ncbi:MAG: secretin N-terminal domain-containing protein, partial [bacterium]